jgi:hypothetical protein
VLSAVKAGSGDLVLIGWLIHSDGRVVRVGNSGQDQSGDVGLVRLALDTRQPDAPIVTCVQTEANELKLITWDDQP